MKNEAFHLEPGRERAPLKVRYACLVIRVKQLEGENERG